MIPPVRTPARRGGSGCSVPTAAAGADVGARFPCSERKCCPATRSRRRCCGRGWSVCSPGFPSTRQRKSCGCRLPWKRFTDYGDNCGGGWIGCARRSVASPPRPPVASRIRCSRPWNISRRCSRPTRVRSPRFNSVSNGLGSGEGGGNASLRRPPLTELPPLDFLGVGFTRSDNATILSLPAPALR